VVHSHAPAELVAAPVEAAPSLVMDFTSALDHMPPPPPALRVPDFDLRPSALVGTVAAQHAAVAAPPAGPSRSLDTQPGASPTLPPTA
jgi:hypothetical protein